MIQFRPQWSRNQDGICSTVWVIVLEYKITIYAKSACFSDILFSYLVFFYKRKYTKNIQKSYCCRKRNLICALRSISEELLIDHDVY
jgi:hypothetical protein